MINLKSLRVPQICEFVSRSKPNLKSPHILKFVNLFCRGIAEVPEIVPEPEPAAPTPVAEAPAPVAETPAPPETFERPEIEPEYYIASYPYQSVEQGDLTFNTGELVTVVKKEGDWWTGKIDDRIGIFPSNYVQKVDSTVRKPHAFDAPD